MSFNTIQSTSRKASTHIPVFHFLRSSTITYLYSEQNPKSISKNYNIFFNLFFVSLTMSVDNSKFVKAFGYAYHGWQRGLKERNLKIELIVALCVLSAAIFFQISSVEWLIIIFLIGIVISAELFNTAIEEVCNIISVKLNLHYPDTTVPRDLAAGAVLVVAVVAAFIGLIIFIPKLLTLLL